MTKILNLRRGAILSALCTAGLLLGAALPARAAAPAAGTPAPDFTLRTADGRNLRLQELRGQVVLINFWATWCGPCREEMPLLDQLQQKYQASGFTLLGVNIDDDPRTATALVQRLGLKFPVLLDSDKKVSKLYALTSMPSTILVDRDGKVRFLHRGYQDGYVAQYEQEVRGLLKE